MACYKINVEGCLGFICGDLGPHCPSCGTVSDSLCDYPVGDNKTCDRLMCAGCSNPVGIDIDYCNNHLKMWNDFKDAGGDIKYLSNNVNIFKTEE